MAHKGKKHTNPGVDTIRQRQLDTKRALEAKKKAKPKKAANSGKSQTNKQYQQDFNKLKGMSKAQIEELRAALRAKKKK